MNERPTFSPFWPRIRSLCPRLRPHVQITRQRYRGRRWHVAHDPTRNSFYRLNPVAYDLVSSLDGVRTVEQAWHSCLEKFGDAAPTQGEVIELVSQLFSSNLLAIDVPPETEQLLRRGTERAKRRVLQQAVGIMYFRLKLLNPEPILRALEPVVRPLLGRVGMILWAVVVFGTLAVVGSRWRDIIAGFDTYILGATPSSFGWMMAVFIALKAWHELGHGLLCKRFGGQVPEAGVFLLVLFPAPYVDASSCWAFPNKWQRIAVASGGMIFELFAASLAAWLWMSSADGTLTKGLAYYAMVTSSVSTLMFNVNPLMRFDGYYILSDLLEVPNLAQRSQQMLQYWFQRYVYRIRSPRSPSSQPGERVILTAYGIASLAYRVLLFVTIILFILGFAFAIGMVLAIWSVAAWFILPLAKFVHWHATSSALADMRWRAAATSIAMCAVVAFAIGVIPLPDYRRAGGVVESVSRTAVFFGTEGFVAECHARPGESVKAGAPIVTLVSPELASMRQAVMAQIDEYTVRGREALAGDDAASVQIALRQLDVLRSHLVDLDDRAGKLVVRAPHDGVIVGADPMRLLGSYVRLGQPAALIVDPGHLRITASLGQAEASWLFQFKPGDYEVLI
ncbi:MAG: PqqD family peptide modification chaperone, partial [Phycisphaerales bacterium]